VANSTEAIFPGLPGQGTSILAVEVHVGRVNGPGGGVGTYLPGPDETFDQQHGHYEFEGCHLVCHRPGSPSAAVIAMLAHAPGSLATVEVMVMLAHTGPISHGGC
jgi:hypothetical protein